MSNATQLTSVQRAMRMPNDFEAQNESGDIMKAVAHQLSKRAHHSHIFVLFDLRIQREIGSLSEKK